LLDDRRYELFNNVHAAFGDGYNEALSERFLAAQYIWNRVQCIQTTLRKSKPLPLTADHPAVVRQIVVCYQPSDGLKLNLAT
jgi:hypothetical protein